MIDLHIHSRYSDDGEYTPAELVAQCAALGIKIMSITDHNCVQAIPEALAAAEEKGITCIPGVEIDCVYEGVNFHVLGYGIDFCSSDFLQIERSVEEQNVRASQVMLEKTQELGFENVTEQNMQEVSKDCCRKGVWTGEMFAEVLLAMPEYRDHPLLEPYRPGGSRNDNPYVNFYWDYYSQGKPCYVKIEFPSMKEIVDTIRRNGGIAVLAHPGINLRGKEYLLDGICTLGMQGIEAFSSYHTPEQARFFYDKAVGNEMLVTCGSDFHGKTKPSIRLGGAVFAQGTDESLVKLWQQRRSRKQRGQKNVVI